MRLPVAQISLIGGTKQSSERKEKKKPEKHNNLTGNFKKGFYKKEMVEERGAGIFSCL